MRATFCVVGPTTADMDAYQGGDLAVALATYVGLTGADVYQTGGVKAGCVIPSPPPPAAGRRMMTSSAPPSTATTSRLMILWASSQDEAQYVAMMLGRLTAASAASATMAARLRATGVYPLTLITAVATATEQLVLVSSPPQPPRPPPQPPLPPRPPGRTRVVDCEHLPPGVKIPKVCAGEVAGSVLGAILALITLWIVIHAAGHMVVSSHIRRTSVTLAVATLCDCSNIKAILANGPRASVTGRISSSAAAEDEAAAAAAAGFGRSGGVASGLGRSTTQRKAAAAFTAHGRRFAAPVFQTVVNELVEVHATQCVQAKGAGATTALLCAQLGTHPTAVTRPLFRHPLMVAAQHMHEAASAQAPVHVTRRLTSRFVTRVAPRGSRLNNFLAAIDTELAWQRRELRYAARWLRRAACCFGAGRRRQEGGAELLNQPAHAPGQSHSQPGGKVFRMVELPETDGSEEPGTAALFCVTVYFGWAGQKAATAFRQAMADGAGIGALEEDLLNCLAAPPMGLEVHAVSEVTAALLDDTEAVSLATDSRISRIAALATPQAVQPPGPTRLAGIMGGLSSYFTAHLHFPDASPIWGGPVSITTEGTPRASYSMHLRPTESPTQQQPPSPQSPPDSDIAERRRIPAFMRQGSSTLAAAAAADVVDQHGLQSPPSTHMQWAAAEVDPVSVRLAPAVEEDAGAETAVAAPAEEEGEDVHLTPAAAAAAPEDAPVEHAPEEAQEPLEEEESQEEDSAGLLAP